MQEKINNIATLVQTKYYYMEERYTHNVIRQVEVMTLEVVCTRTWSAPYPFQLPSKNIPDLIRLCIIIGNSFLTFYKEILIIASICVYCTMIHLHDRIADPVKEISVVSHHQKGAA